MGSNRIRFESAAEGGDPSHPLRAMKDLNFDKATLYRNGILALMLVAIAMIVHGLYGQNGYLALRRQQQELLMLQHQIQQLKQENEQLEKQIKALESDPAAIERLAREQMHLAKPGEIIYTEPDRPAETQPPPTAKESPSKR